MTPFGEKLRAMRRARGVSQKEMADAIGVSAAYLSALEHGRRGAPSWVMVQAIIGYFNVIWDEADDLQKLAECSHPRVVVDTAGLSPRATELAYLLGSGIAQLEDAQIDELSSRLRTMLAKPQA